MLLYHVGGPTCWEDLRTVNGEVCETFQEACIKLGLFEDDSEIEKCLTEAATVKFPKQFRHLYVTLMVQSMAANPRHLYEKFKAELSEDFMKKERISALIEGDAKSEDVINSALLELNELFEAAGKDMVNDFGLPEPVNRPQNKIDRVEQEELYEDISEQLTEEAENSISKLNGEQKLVFDTVKNALDSENGGVFAIDAPGGTGKTFVLTTLLNYVRGKGDIGFAMATSGIAATLLPGRRKKLKKISKNHRALLLSKPNPNST